MKRLAIFIMMFSFVAVGLCQVSQAQIGNLQCKYFEGTTFTIDGDLSEWPADSLILEDITVADQGSPTDLWPDPNPAYSVDVYTAWDDDYFYIAYDVTDPDAGLKTSEHPDFNGNRFVKDMLRIYWEMDNDGSNEYGADSGEVSWDIMASQSNGPYQISHMTVNSSGGDFNTDSANYANSVNGTLVENASSDGAGQYIVEARLSWLDLADRLSIAGMPYTKPSNGTVWRYDFLFIDDTPIQDHVDNDEGYEGGGQFVLHTLHDPATWENFTFLDTSMIAPANPAVHDGYYACKVINNAGAVFLDRDTGGGHFQLNGGTEFLVSFWMRSGGDAPVAMTGQVQPFDSTPSYMPPATNIFNDIFAEPVPTDWTYYEGTYVPEEGVTEISLRFDNPNGTSYIIDDVKVIDTTSGENIIPNGSFEEWGEGATVAGGSDILIAEDGVPNTWRFVSLSDGDGEIVRLGSLVVTNAQEGMYAAKVTRTAGGGDSAFDKDFGAPPDAHMSIEGIAELKLSFWMRSGTGANVPVGGQIQPFGSGGYMPPSVDVVGPLFADGVPATWKYFESAPYVPDEGVLEVSVRFNTTAPNSFVVDDIKLIDTATGTDIMTNGGMEAWGGGAIVGDPVAPDGVPDNWRMFAVAGAGGMIERLQFQPPAPNAIQIDWTTMQ